MSTDTTLAPVSDVAIDPEADATAATSAPELVEDELLVEEISIDGMCGVY